MSSCGSCFTSSSELCTTVYPVLSPCACDDPAPIREEGPDGQTGPKGPPPAFTIGTVGTGDASVTVVVTDGVNRVINWVIPVVPEGVPYSWSKVQTFEQPAIFELGVSTTGGSTTFGGAGLIVTPDAVLAADANMASDLSVGVDLNVSADVVESAGLAITGLTTLQDLALSTQTDLTGATLDVANETEYASGAIALGSCLDPEIQPNVANGIYTKAQATGLVAVGPTDNDVICDTITFNVPASACGPQVTPLVEVRIRVSYAFGGSAPPPFANFNISLWQTMVGGTQVDFYTQGDVLTFNSWYGSFELRGQALMSLGNNDFLLQVTNNSAADTFTPLEVTYWFIT